MQKVPGKNPHSGRKGLALDDLLACEGLEARVGIEPTHKGFADLSLTTWVPRLGRAALCLIRSRPP